MVTDRWWWSDETYHLHGFEPHDVVPTTELVLAHKHPEDREAFRTLLNAARVTGDPFTSTHRIMDARGRERTVCLVGQGRRDPGTGAVVEVMGYYTDLTSILAARAEELAGQQIRAAAVNRATIEQAKGVLAVVYGTSIEDAFALLRITSNNHNIPVRTLCAWIVALVPLLPGDELRRHQVDEFLHSPHEPC
ncbi:PAS and ANTAR domain-containing protein [Oerskovia sp. M15]